MTDSIVRAIAPTLRHAELERVRRKRPESMDAYDLYLRALPHWHAMTREGNEEAMRYLTQALALEPDYAPALAVQAMLLAYKRVLGWTDATDAQREELLRLARLAVRRDPSDPDVIAGAAHFLAWAAAEFDEAVELAKRACKLGPNSAFVWSQVGAAQFHAGLWREAASSLEHALQLDPIDPMGYTVLSHLAFVKINLGDEVGAIEVASKAVRQNPSYAFAWRALAAAQALAGRITEGRTSLQTMLRLQPGYSILGSRQIAPVNGRSFERTWQGLCLLGLPDH